MMCTRCTSGVTSQEEETVGRFTRICKLRGGHTLFTDNDNPDKGVAIADESGGAPDQTDDGVLYVDVKRIAERGVKNCTVKNCAVKLFSSVCVPVVGAGGEESHTLMSVPDALHLLSLLRLPERVMVENEHGDRYMAVPCAQGVASAGV